MEPNIHLILHNLTSAVSSLILLGLSLFTFLNNRKSVANITLAAALFFLMIFTVSHVIGVNITDPNLSKTILMFNLSMFFIGSFVAHSIIYIIGKEKENRWIIILLHSTAIFFTIFFIIFPDLFLLPSAPKMYFPNYYVPGALNWTRLVFLDGICLAYAVYLLFSTYIKADSELVKKQHQYFITSTIIASGFGLLPNLLVYNVPFDPLIGMLFPVLFIVPFLYGAVKYEMFNIKIVAKQAFFYAIGIVATGGAIILFNYSNELVISLFPSYQTWVTALVSSILLVTISVIVWKNLRESDLLKYEFITTVTHKFRTPLTGIKWAVENLNSSTTLSQEDKEQLRYIKSSNDKLVALTDLLVTTSESEHNSYQYKFLEGNITEAVKDIIGSIKDEVEMKQLTINNSLQENTKANCDLTKIKFVIQTLIENAIHYTKNNGTVTISLTNNDKEIIFSVHDTGMGISKDESALIFSKFYRTSEAQTADTEGMGIGLFISKEIIQRHKGKIWAESKGLDKGSTFSFSLPLNK